MEQKSRSIEERLDRIERAVLGQKNVLSFDEWCLYCGFSESWGYKLTSANKVEFSRPEGKMIYFDRAKVDAWLLQNPVRTTATLQAEAKQSLRLKKGGRGK